MHANFLNHKGISKIRGQLNPFATLQDTSKVAELLTSRDSCYTYTAELFITCIVDNQITISNPTKCTILHPNVLYYNILLVNPTCFDPSWDHHQGFIPK
jgi:hypothetical protein